MDTRDTIFIEIKIDEYVIDFLKVYCSQPKLLKSRIQLYCHHTCIVGTQHKEKVDNNHWPQFSFNFGVSVYVLLVGLFGLIAKGLGDAAGADSPAGRSGHSLCSAGSLQAQCPGLVCNNKSEDTQHNKSI